MEENNNDFVEEEKENFSRKRLFNQNKKGFKTSKDNVFDRFKDVEYKELCSIDEILFKGENDTGTNINIFKIQARQENFKLGTYFLNEKRKFLNTLRFFNDTKKSSYSDDDDDEIDSDEEDIGPTDFIELIEELANRCNQYEDKIVTLRETIIQKSKELDLNIRKCRDLDRHAKDLNETISVTKSRSTKEMEETINLADQTTQGIADKLPSIRTRIRDKSEKLKEHQQLLMKLKNQVEIEKKSSKILAQCRIVGAILVILIIINIPFLLDQLLLQFFFCRVLASFSNRNQMIYKFLLV
ncbi:hypothetical protein C1645_320268 [Glomus cerebriforme]|uniref:Uncharacterized protein n=1 Tax=Glomus cerebriforme TaxID=658196 RepID=A0A397SKQ0_9GLOM|nr:hypothetical protein C1645_320268 [Glomus cerebriforme]